MADSEAEALEEASLEDSSTGDSSLNEATVEDTAPDLEAIPRSGTLKLRYQELGLMFVARMEDTSSEDAELTEIHMNSGKVLDTLFLQLEEQLSTEPASIKKLNSGLDRIYTWNNYVYTLTVNQNNEVQSAIITRTG